MLFYCKSNGMKGILEIELIDIIINNAFVFIQIEIHADVLIHHFPVTFQNIQGLIILVKIIPVRKHTVLKLPANLIKKEYRTTFLFLTIKYKKVSFYL